MFWLTGLGIAAAEGGGTALLREDWFARLPLAVVVVTFVVVVDTIVIVRTLRAMRRETA